MFFDFVLAMKYYRCPDYDGKLIIKVVQTVMKNLLLIVFFKGIFRSFPMTFLDDVTINQRNVIALRTFSWHPTSGYSGIQLHPRV